MRLAVFQRRVRSSARENFDHSPSTYGTGKPQRGVLD